MKHKDTRRPITISQWSDHYTLGMFCRKTHLIRYARSKLSVLHGNSDENRLFELGIREADQCTFADLAHEITILREKSYSAAAFDAFIQRMAGGKIFAEMQEALADAHDWENEKMVAFKPEDILRLRQF